MQKKITGTGDFPREVMQGAESMAAEARKTALHESERK